MRLLSLYQIRFAATISPPIPVRDIAVELLRLKIQHEPLPMFEKLPDPLRRAALDAERRVVYIDAETPPEVQSFSLAHEIGHFKLHRLETEKPQLDPDLLIRIRKRREREADLFATFLLMPDYLIEDCAHSHGTFNPDSVKRLSRIFEVSSLAMHWRLKALELMGLPGSQQLAMRGGPQGPHGGASG